MYANIWPLLAVGGVAAVGSVTSFFTMKMRWTIILSVIALVFGYLPWFVITVAAFEHEDTGATGGRARPKLLSPEDCRRPLLLITKLLLMLTVGPIIILAFFLPYVMYTALCRPCLNHVLPALASCILHVIIPALCYSYMFMAFALRHLFTGMAVLYVMCLDAIKFVLKTLLRIGSFVKDIIILPACAFVTAVCVGCRRGLEAAALGISAAKQTLWRVVISPTWKFIAATATALFQQVLLPIGIAVCTATSAVRCCMLSLAGYVATAAGMAYSYVLAPSAKRAVVCARAGHRGCFICASYLARMVHSCVGAMCTWICVPIGTCIYVAANGIMTMFDMCIAGIQRCIITATTASYVYLLLPVAQRLWKCMAGLWRAITVCMSPLVHCVAALSHFVHRALAALHANAFRPIWQYMHGITMYAAAGFRHAGEFIGGFGRTMARKFKSAGSWAQQCSNDVRSTVRESVASLRDALRWL
eukprot:gnl/TRDRNA2_/TRDRNA2_142938_c1_seq1.p1 gnl/TRDRNA2_/TRDRNA2_142938_c1~~gnl/TRDRNA2_/TRDRNA2_142938_c1_seq1.p1  ORF type:complete len:513 (+),score=40.62 gnl/TRDRNA2_/TRDRNA2_142938_c1_seq1:118-1539(+)